eukprot:940793_1
MLDSLLLDKLILAIALHRSSCKSSMHFRLWLDRSSNPDSQSFKYSTMKLCVKVCIRRLLVRSPIKNSTAHQLSQAPSPIMSQSPQHRNLVMDTYNKIVQNGIDNPLELLQSTIDYLTFEKSNVSEISLLYCLQSDYYFEKGQYDEAYKFIIAAAQIDSERKEVLQSLINIHTPQANDNEGNKNNSYSASSNPYEDDEKAHEYCIKLENLYPDDIQSLYVTSHCYSALGLYDNAIHILKRVFSKMDGSADFADEIKKRITTTLIARYSNCPNDSHETIIRYLIELIEWKYNGFQAATLQAYIEEIWKRIEYILNKHMDSVTVNKQNKDLHKMESEWNTILKLLCSIPCSIPLSAHLMNYILDVFMKNNEYKCGVEFFTRLIAEYQTFDGNGLSIHATFDKYDVLYLNRAKLYHVLGAKQKMLNNIEYCNRRLLRNARDMTKTELVNECNVAQYVIQDANEKPIIETSQQIKISEPVADRNQTNEVDTDEKEEEECKEHATTNDSENENKTDETLSQRKASPTLDVKAIDIHTKTPHPPSKVSQTMTHRDVSSEKSMVDTPDMDGKDGEESTEQSITNSDSEGETKTQETQDDEDNKRNKQSIKVSIGRDNEGKVRPPIDGNNNAIEWQTGPNGGRYYVTESGDKYYNSTDATLIYGEDEYGRILYRGVKGGYYFLSGTGQSKQYVTLPKDIVEAYRKRHLKFINVQSDSE